MVAPPPSALAALSKRRSRFALFALVGLHYAMVLHFLPPDVIFKKTPIYDIDYSLHYYQVDRAVKAFRSTGKLWGYDPRVLAGHPAGAIEDVSFKAVELFVIALRAMRVHPAVAYNLFIFLVHLLMPFAALFAARLFRLDHWQRVTLLGIWIVLWTFDSFVHWVWYCGMISWALASYLGVLLIGFALRATEDRRPRHFIGLGLLASFLALHHPFIALSVAVPIGGIYLRAAKSLSRRQWLASGLCLAASIATALIWLVPAWKMRHYMLTEETFLRPGLDYLLWDFLDLTRDADQVGPLSRTGFRFLCLAAAAVGLWQWRKSSDRRLLPFVLLAATALFFAYGGAYISLSRVTQPYRHIVPMILGLAIPAAVYLTGALRGATLRGLSRPAKLMLLVLLVFAVPRLARTVLIYFPVNDALKSSKFKSKNSSFRQAGYFSTPSYPMRSHGPPNYTPELVEWLNANIYNSGRIVVQDYMLGEYLAATTKLPILGGLVQRSFHHGDAHLFRINREGHLPGNELKRYFERYAVRFVVMTKIHRRLEWRRDLLAFRGVIGGVRIYETKINPSYFQRGRGIVISQKFNSIEAILTPDDDGKLSHDVILRFHWMEGLACRPNCRVERQPVNDDRVGFIRIPHAPPRFTIYNSYVW